jgi:hypothetical protein
MDLSRLCTCDKNFSLKIIPTAISSRTPVLGLHHKMNCTFHFTHFLIQLAVRMFIHSKKHGSSKPFAEEKKGPAHMALRPLLLFLSGAMGKARPGRGDRRQGMCCVALENAFSCRSPFSPSVTNVTGKTEGPQTELFFSLFPYTVLISYRLPVLSWAEMDFLIR